MNGREFIYALGAMSALFFAGLIIGLMAGGSQTKQLPIKCKHGGQWERFMHPDSLPVIIILEDGTVIEHEKL